MTGDADRTDALDDGGAFAIEKRSAWRWEADMAPCPEAMSEGFTRRVKSVCAIGKEGGEFCGVRKVDEVMADGQVVGRGYRREASGNGGEEEGEEIDEGGGEEVGGLGGQIVVEYWELAGFEARFEVGEAGRAS